MTLKSTRDRLLWVDYAKAFSILCVVLHHTLLSEPIYSISYQLCLSTFFVLSGMFFPQQLSYGSFIAKRAKQLLIPYILFATLSYGIWWFIGRHVGIEKDDVCWWEPLLGVIIGTRDSIITYRPLWFLTCLFVTENLYYLIQCIHSRYIRRLVLVCFMAIGFLLGYKAIILPWGTTSACVMVGLYAIGHTLQQHGTSSFQSISISRLLVIVLISALLFIVGYIFNPTTEISCSQFGNPLLFLLSTLSAAALWITLGIVLETKWGSIPFLCILGRHTLLILGFHLHCFAFIKGCMVYLLQWDINSLSDNSIKWIIYLCTILLFWIVLTLYQQIVK